MSRFDVQTKIMKWGTPEEIERRRRIRLSLWAYAYEFKHRSLVPDHQFDFESYMLDKRVTTNRPDLDFFFVCYFDPCTGIWIHQHPELSKIASLYERIY